jgi:hypothetical protein
MTVSHVSLVLVMRFVLCARKDTDPED